MEHPKQKSFGTNRIDLYDGEILYTDKYVGKLLKLVLDKREDPNLVILASDHGDGFESDRGKRNHGYGLFNEIIHVPLIVWAPGSRPQRVKTPVANLDIAATLINAAGLNKPYLRGHSFVPYIYNKYRDPNRLIYSADAYGSKRVGYQRSVTGIRWKMIRWLKKNKEFLYDLKKDPKEKHNVIMKYPNIAERLRRHLNLSIERDAADTLDLE